MAIHVDAKNGQPTSKADPESFFENIYPDPPTLEDARKLRPPKPRVVRKKADVDESNREKPKSQRSTTTKFSIVKSDDDPAA